MKIMYSTIVLLVIFIQTCTAACTDIGGVCVYSADCCSPLNCYWVNIDDRLASEDSTDYGIYDEKRCFGANQKCVDENKPCVNSEDCCDKSGQECALGKCKIVR
eukprot:2079_1